MSEFQLTNPPTWPDTFECLSGGVRIPFKRYGDTIVVEDKYATDFCVRKIVRSREQAEEARKKEGK